MQRVLGVALAITLVVASTGCYSVTVRTGKQPSGVVQEQTAHIFLFGLIGSEVTAPCEPAVVETKMGVLGWVLAIITGSLYTPFNVTTTCAASGAAGR